MVVEVHLNNHVFKRGSCKELKNIYMSILLQSNICKRHSKCEDLVVAHGRWSLTRIAKQGSLPRRGLDTSNFREIMYCKQSLIDVYV